MYFNQLKAELWHKSKGDKKLYSKMLRNKEKEAKLVQKNEKISNLKRMLYKKSITIEEYNEKMLKI